MPGPAVDILRRFGSVEDDQRYTRLVELFADDAVYYDPFLGPQRGRAAIAAFMAHMEEVVPAAGVRFADWEVEADRVVGWARWTMVGSRRDADGHTEEVAVPGQSLYRLNDAAQVTFVADYVDPVAQRRLRPGGRLPDLAGAAGISASPHAPGGSALEVIRRFWSIQDSGAYAQLGELFSHDAVFTDLIYGRFEGREAVVGYLTQMQSEMPAGGIRFELVDVAGDETVAWSQWTCHLPGGSVPGWTLHTLRDGRITLDADFFDTVAARAIGGP
jgi:ketosteroid isomerase-like protein